MSQTLIDSARDQLKAELAKRAELQEQMDALIAGVEERGDGQLTDDESTKMTELRADLQELDAKRADLEARVEDLAADEAARKHAADIADKFGDPKEDRSVDTVTTKVKNEPDLYSLHGEHSFITDAYRAQIKHDRSAIERIERHQAFELGRMETRDTTTSAFGALVVPQYLTNLFAANLHAGRPFLNAVTSLPLPDEGETINVPRGTTKTSAAAQAAQNNALSETDFDETTLAVSVRTYGGQQDVSRQSLDRGRGIDGIIFADLAGAYSASVDSDALSADGTSGTHLGILNVSGINAVTYTDATPTVAEAYPKIADALQRITANRFMNPDLIVMHPRRWAWFMSAVDGQNRPLVVPRANVPENAMGVGMISAPGFVGQIAGVDVLVDANVPTNLGAGTNEDRIIVTRRSDVIFMEEANAPRRFEFEQTAGGNLTVKLGLFGYSAFTAGRYPVATSVISGTGLVAPTF